MAVIRPSPGLIRDVFRLERSRGGAAGHLVAIAALGMAVPVFVGLLLGHVEAGLTIGLGAVLLAGPPEDAGSERHRDLVVAMLPALLAILAALLASAAPWPDIGVILLAAVSGFVSGYSRPVAVAAIRFGVYLVLCAGFLDGVADHRPLAAAIFATGALWNMTLRALIMHVGPRLVDAPDAQRAPGLARRFAYFRNTLRSLDGWQFPSRLVLGLALGSLIRHLFPTHHFYWIMLTVALLTERPIAHVPVKTAQRVLGTIAGVGIAAVARAVLTPQLGLPIFLCALAAALPVARVGSYLVYASLTTPLILLLLDFGTTLAPRLLTDRLLATLIGGTVVIMLNLIFDRPGRIPQSSKTRASRTA